MYIDNAMLKGRVKTGRSHLWKTEFNALEKTGLETTTEHNEEYGVKSQADRPNRFAHQQVCS